MSTDKIKGQRMYSATDETARSNMVEKLDSRIVAMINPAKGHWYKNVQMSGQYSDGAGACLSNGNGVQGVIDKVNGKIRVGAGYTNLFKGFDMIGGIETLGDGRYKLYGNSGGSTFFWNFTENGWTGQANVRMRFEILETSLAGGSHFRTHSTDPSYATNTVGVYDDLFTGTGGGTIGSLGIACNAGGNATDYIIIGNIQVLINETEEKPYVPSKAQDGRIVIDEPWTTATHSFIGLGLEVQVTGQNQYVHTMHDGILGTGEAVYLTGADAVEGDVFDIIVNNTIAKAIRRSDSTEFNLQVINTGNVGDGMRSLTYHFSAGFSFLHIEKDFSYVGNLTEQELRDQLAIIKRDNYQVSEEFVGTSHAIPYAPYVRDDGDFDNFTGVFEFGNHPSFSAVMDMFSDEYMPRFQFVEGCIVSCQGVFKPVATWSAGVRHTFIGLIHERLRPRYGFEFVISLDVNQGTPRRVGEGYVRSDGNVYIEVQEQVTTGQTLTFL